MVETVYTQGFTRRAIDVAWPSGEKIAVVEFGYGCNWRRPLFPMSGFAFTPDTPDVTVTPIEYLIPLPGATPPIVNPFSDNMIKKVYWWDRHTKFSTNSDNTYQCKALWFFNLARIKAKLPPGKTPATYTDFKFTIGVPAGTATNQTGTVYWIWRADFGSLAANQDNPQIMNIGFPYTVVVPTVAASQAEADFIAGLLETNEVVFDFVVEPETTPEIFADLLSWTTRISTYPKPPAKKRRDFPSDPPDTVDIDWNPNTESVAHTSAHGEWPDFVTPTPARNINYSVNFGTLAVSITA